MGSLIFFYLLHVVLPLRYIGVNICMCMYKVQSQPFAEVVVGERG